MVRTCSLAVVVLLVLAITLGVGAPALAAAGKPRIVLAPLSDTSIPEAGKQKADGIVQAMMTGLKEALFKSGKFVLVADADVQKDLDADRYNQYLSGDFNPAQAAAIGQKVGAQALIKCSVVTNQFSSQTKDLILVKETEFRMQLAVAVEICDIEKAVISFMDKASVEKTTKAKQLVLGSTPGGQPPISLSNPNDVRALAVNEIVTQLAAKIVTNAVKEKGKGSVTSVKGLGRESDTIVVDIGAGQGAGEDMELTVMGVDEDGFEEKIGKAKITNVLEDKCKATIIEAKRPVLPGDAVQMSAGGGAAASSGGTTEVTTEATATGEGTSRDSAINDALTQAIQQVAGVYIMSETEGKNYQVVKNELFSQTKGFISKYDVIGDASASGGITTIKVKALVSNRPVFDALLARRIVSRQRVMVVVPETHLKMVVPDPAGETQIIKRLIDNSFLVVDQKQSKEISANESKRALIKGDATAVLAMIGKTDAEVLIYGEAFSEGAQRVTTGSGDKFTCGARIEVRAVETDTARILYADAAQATSVDATEALAGKRALMAAAELLCNGKDGQKGFVDQILDKVLDTTHYVQCVISGLNSEQDLAAVEDGLREAIGNRPVHRYSYSDGVAKVNLETPKTAQDVTGEISRLTMKGKLKLVGNTVNRIDLQYSK